MQKAPLYVGKLTRRERRVLQLLREAAAGAALSAAPIDAAALDAIVEHARCVGLKIWPLDAQFLADDEAAILAWLAVLQRTWVDRPAAEDGSAAFAICAEALKQAGLLLPFKATYRVDGRGELDRVRRRGRQHSPQPPAKQTA